MKHSHLLGNLPTRKSGMLNRPEAASELGVSVAALHKGYNNWCQIFRIVGSSLTLVQYFEKLNEAGITVFDLGVTVGRYNLSRYNDNGPYTNISCRFILVEENHNEQVFVAPFQRMVAKYGRDAAVEHNRRAGAISLPARLVKARLPKSEEQKKRISAAIRTSWITRKATKNVKG
jgi:hypothetical protein